MAKINFVNIGILLALLVSGVFVSFQDGQHDKAAVAAGITGAGAAVSSIAPSSSISEAMPSIVVNSVDNSIVVSSGLNLLIILAAVGIVAVILGFVNCVSCYARC